MPPVRPWRRALFLVVESPSFAPSACWRKLDEDEQIGVNAVRRALEEPLRQIAQNAGVEGQGNFPECE
jgi:hypothetical protein